jgi:YesN/AraC family two-component response regulator
VTSADCGQAALSEADKADFAVALLDIKMPDITGIEVLRYLKQKKSDISVIMMTGYSETDYAIDALNAGAAGYLYKPGQTIKAKIIEIKDDKISLSIKALKKNPWDEVADEYKKGDQVRGVVIKHNKHGALVSIKDGVSGLVHVSEFASIEELRQRLELGKSYSFTINVFEPRTQKLIMGLPGKAPATA